MDKAALAAVREEVFDRMRDAAIQRLVDIMQARRRFLDGIYQPEHPIIEELWGECGRTIYEKFLCNRIEPDRNGRDVVVCALDGNFAFFDASTPEGAAKLQSVFRGAPAFIVPAQSVVLG